MIMAKTIMQFSVILFSITVVAHQDDCAEAQCGINELVKIRFPFRLKDKQPSHCGYPGFDLFCSGPNTSIQLPNIPIIFYVSSIDYSSQEIYFDSPQDICLFVNQSMKTIHNLSVSPFHYDSHDYTKLKCSSTCNINSYYGEPICFSDERYSYYYVYSLDSIYDTVLSCKCRKMFDLELPYIWDLRWSKPDCRKCEKRGKLCRLKKGGAEGETECYPEDQNGDGRSISPKDQVITCVIVGSFVLILAVVAMYYLYNQQTKDRESRRNIKIFLDDYNALKPSRYAYYDIKKITSHFHEKLGQGAYGTVFKGKLSNDVFVAVKILNNSAGNGDEFINEVATIGQIHHVNVVRLVGYCAEGFHRALIYEFLPNDSLDKYISQSLPSNSNPSLSWETRRAIALGIAKGIEYLHQGCDQRILHFDIKPHNVLLDTNYVPKVSDFGLAKLCSKDQSAVSMNTARGTMGYIAPEVFSRNFGNVSYKSDVYSFGMLLLEMVGGKKSTNVTKENVDEVYYPEWIYNLLEGGEDFRIVVDEERNAEIAKKLAIVGLWCIQWHPMSRPTMKFVVQMLEGETELKMPPNPFASITSSTRNTNIPQRRVANLELEAIAE